jgi:hypothetical protein
VGIALATQVFCEKSLGLQRTHGFCVTASVAAGKVFLPPIGFEFLRKMDAETNNLAHLSTSGIYNGNGLLTEAIPINSNTKPLIPNKSSVPCALMPLSIQNPSNCVNCVQRHDKDRPAHFRPPLHKLFLANKAACPQDSCYGNQSKVTSTEETKDEGQDKLILHMTSCTNNNGPITIVGSSEDL